MDMNSRPDHRSRGLIVGCRSPYVSAGATGAFLKLWTKPNNVPITRQNGLRLAFICGHSSEIAQLSLVSKRTHEVRRLTAGCIAVTHQYFRCDQLIREARVDRNRSAAL